MREPVDNNDVHQEDNANELPAGTGHCFLF
jgi:hypothetical protein